MKHFTCAKTVTCPQCNGFGVINGGKQCPKCNGSGSLATRDGRAVCSQCGGSGEVERVVNEIVADDEVTTQ